MADFDNFDAIGLSGEADPLFLRRYPPVMDRQESALIMQRTRRSRSKGQSVDPREQKPRASK
jgi:hypothetical protein